MKRGHPVRLSAQRELSEVIVPPRYERASPAGGQDVRAPITVASIPVDERVDSISLWEESPTVREGSGTEPGAVATGFFGEVPFRSQRPARYRERFRTELVFEPSQLIEHHFIDKTPTPLFAGFE